MFLCQHLGVAPEEGAYSRDKSQIPHISPPTLSTRAKVAKWGAYIRDTTVHGVSCFEGKLHYCTCITQHIIRNTRLVLHVLIIASSKESQVVLPKCACTFSPN